MSYRESDKSANNGGSHPFAEQYKSRGLFSAPTTGQSTILANIDEKHLAKQNPDLMKPHNNWFDAWLNIGNEADEQPNTNSIGCKC